PSGPCPLEEVTRGPAPPLPHPRRPAPPPIRPVDLAVGAGILALLHGVLRLGRSMNVAFLPASVRRGVDEPRPPAPVRGTVAPAHVHRPAPLGVALTFVYATAAARRRWALQPAAAVGHLA